MNEICSRWIILFSAIVSFSNLELAAARVSALSPIQKLNIINTSQCQGERMERALESLVCSLPDGGLPALDISLCNDAGKLERCDGGFTWQPLMVNRARALVTYTLNQDSLSEILAGWTGVPGLGGTARPEEVVVSLRNICSQNNLVTGSFYNHSENPFGEEAVWAKASSFDASQAAFKGFDDIYLKLYVSENGSHVGVYGQSRDQKKLIYIDDFVVEPLVN